MLSTLCYSRHNFSRCQHFWLHHFFPLQTHHFMIVIDGKSKSTMALFTFFYTWMLSVHFTCMSSADGCCCCCTVAIASTFDRMEFILCCALFDLATKIAHKKWARPKNCSSRAEIRRLQQLPPRYWEPRIISSERFSFSIRYSLVRPNQKFWRIQSKKNSQSKFCSKNPSFSENHLKHSIKIHMCEHKKWPRSIGIRLDWWSVIEINRKIPVHFWSVCVVWCEKQRNCVSHFHFITFGVETATERCICSSPTVHCLYVCFFGSDKNLRFIHTFTELEKKLFLICSYCLRATWNGKKQLFNIFIYIFWIFSVSHSVRRRPNRRAKEKMRELN